MGNRDLTVSYLNIVHIYLGILVLHYNVHLNAVHVLEKLRLLYVKCFCDVLYSFRLFKQLLDIETLIAIRKLFQ